MKKIILLSALLYVFTWLMSAFAQVNTHNPLAYPYYIYGEQEITGPESSVLSNVQYKGFITNIPEGGVNNGYKNYNEKIVYQFDSIRTYPYLDIRGKQLQYWRKLENGESITDIETGNGIATHRRDQVACMMLVLDCSKSLGLEFARVKQAAVNFIDMMYNASSAGNIHIGIVCFSTMNDTQLFPVTSLTESSRLQMRNFIGKQTNNLKATSMYYAMNKGINELVSYVDRLDSAKYEGAHMITFTDGLDNTSQLEGKYSLKQVREQVKEELGTKTLKGKLIDSWVVGVKGEDVTDGQLSLMRSQLSELVSNNDQFKFLVHISRLESEFRDIADRLTKRWLSLECTSALNHDGSVCWTYGEVKEEPKPTPPPVVVKEKHMLLGAHYAIGFCMYAPYWSSYGYTVTDIKTGVGLDVAYPITSKFGMGGYFSIGYPYMALGLLTTIGDYQDGKAAFVGGLGMDVGFIAPSVNFDLRGGVLFRNGLYLMLDLSTGMDPIAMTFNIGYNFGNLFTVD